MLVMKCHTIFVTNLHRTPRRAAPIAFFHTMAVCSMYLPPPPSWTQLRSFQCIWGKKAKAGWALQKAHWTIWECSQKRCPEFPTQNRNIFSFILGHHFLSDLGLTVGYFPWIQWRPSFRSQLHFQHCQSKAGSCCCKGVGWSSFCCLCHVEALSWSHSSLLARENRHSRVLIRIWTYG